MSNFTSKWICGKCACDVKRREAECGVCFAGATSFLERYECQRCFRERKDCECYYEPPPLKPQLAIPPTMDKKKKTYEEPNLATIVLLLGLFSFFCYFIPFFGLS